jgi:hypothetical protein
LGFEWHGDDSLDGRKAEAMGLHSNRNYILMLRPLHFGLNLGGRRTAQSKSYVSVS